MERIGAAIPESNGKSRLQEEAQAAGRGIPGYRVVQVEGPDHERRFLVAVSVGGQDLGEGWGRTKKEAEQNAATQALEGPWQDLRREPNSEANHDDTTSTT